MLSLAQDILKTLLSIKNSTPERLSTHETAIAARICHCCNCGYMWIRRKADIPNRCPKCHVRAWDRPLLTAMIAASTATTTQQPRQASTPTPQEKKNDNL